MKVFVWQWGRRGAGPRFAATLADGLRALPGVEAQLALPAEAEILGTPDAPTCNLLLPAYENVASLLVRVAQAPLFVAATRRHLRALGTSLAICAMPAPLDLLMWSALRRAHVPMAVIVHDAAPHPGDGYPLQFRLQRMLIRRADAVIVLSDHVAESLRTQRLLRLGTRLLIERHPPFAFPDAQPRPPEANGPIRVLSFGRLLPYKGLDLLADALRILGPRGDMLVRVVGKGPESSALTALRGLPGVTVENRWVPEIELGALIGWADLVVLPYREASQSGVAAAALASERHVLSTRVGGLVQQLGAERMATLCAPDPAAIAVALSELLDALRQVRSSRSKDKAKPTASWEAFAARVLAELRGLTPLQPGRSG